MTPSCQYNEGALQVIFRLPVPIRHSLDMTEKIVENNVKPEHQILPHTEKMGLKWSIGALLMFGLHPKETCDKGFKL